MSGKTNTKAKATPISRRPKRGTVTTASERGVKFNKAKTPRPDKRTKRGRKRQAKQAKADRTRRAAARPVDREVRSDLSANERGRLEALEAILRATHEKARRLLGVSDDVELRGADPRPHFLARGIYLLAVRAAGFRVSDYARHKRADGCLVPELRKSSAWSQVHYLYKNTETYLAASPRSPLVSAARAAVDVLTAYATTKLRATERKYGPRPDARNKPSQAPVRAKRAVKKAARRRVAEAQPSPGVVTPVAPPEAEQVQLFSNLSSTETAA